MRRVGMFVLSFVFMLALSGFVVADHDDNDYCGDGKLDETEQCDDSNFKSGDGCSSTCKVESGYTCSDDYGELSVCEGDSSVSPAEECVETSDGGLNEMIKGAAYVGNNVKEDYCYTKNIVGEAFCVENPEPSEAQYAAELITCPENAPYCSDGVCVEEQFTEFSEDSKLVPISIDYKSWSNPEGSPEDPYAMEFVFIIPIVENQGESTISKEELLNSFPDFYLEDFVFKSTNDIQWAPNGGYWNPTQSAGLAPGQKARPWITGYFKSPGNKELTMTTSVSSFTRTVHVLDDPGCYDSDGGNNEFVKGWTIGTGSCSDQDSCLSSIRHEDQCSKDGVYLSEYACGEYPYKGAIRLFYEGIECPNGCEDGACIRGTEVADPKNTITVDVSEGWNLIHGFFNPEQITEGDIGEDNIIVTYALMSNLQEYAMVWPDEDSEKLETVYAEQIMNTGMWVYSDKSGVMTYELVDKVLPLNERNIYAGWNFVGISEDMIGENSLEDLAGNCDIKRSYSFYKQGWLEVGLSTVLSQEGEIGKVWVINVAEDCRLGADSEVVVSAPPVLPGLGIIDDEIYNETTGDVDLSSAGEPLVIGDYELVNYESRDNVCDNDDKCASLVYLTYSNNFDDNVVLVQLIDYLNGTDRLIDSLRGENLYRLQSNSLPYIYTDDREKIFLWLTNNKYDIVIVNGENLNEDNPVVIFFYYKYRGIDVELGVVEDVVNKGDCVPASCCSASSCVWESEAPACSEISCLDVCSPGSMDCGAGSCEVVNGECGVVWNDDERTFGDYLVLVDPSDTSDPLRHIP